MMAQYLRLKAEADFCLLFYRMGDFFELFFEDAKAAAAALDIALTSRGEHDGAPIPMCGVPVHSAESYLARLIKAGFRVAIAEQTESPAEAKARGSKALVERAIVRFRLEVQILRHHRRWGAVHLSGISVQGPAFQRARYRSHTAIHRKRTGWPRRS
jgi:DNA mismatch repair ATPase MutS